MRHFARLALAQDVCRSLRGESLFGDAHNGLFLAAPRRTGKSTFLQIDLKPELERSGTVVVYVDLWADRRRDPGSLIAEAIARTLAAHLGPATRAAKAMGIEGVTLAGTVKIDLGKIGRVDGATLVDALRALHEVARKPVALIIDEAQHALTSEAGESAMAALKSARDQLNAPGIVNLMLVMSGSDRDKLLRLVNANGAPFYGSTITRMPTLDKDYVDYVVAIIEKERPDLVPVDAKALLEAFSIFGNRPQFFNDALGQALNPLAESEDRFEQDVISRARQRERDDEAQMESEYLALKPIERAVVWRLLDMGERFRPYDAEALRFYRDKAGAAVSAQKVQQALESLRERTPALAWKSARGEYAIDDALMLRWYHKRLAAGTWPPTDALESID